MVKRSLNFILANLFIFSFLFTSCVNKDYDLDKDIDLTFHVGGDGLALPVGNTDYIRLSKIIKVDESDVLHLDGGEYSLLKEDVVSPVSVSVPSTSPISITPIYLESANLYTLAGLSTRASRGDVTFDLNVPSTTKSFNLSHQGIPVEVKSIKSITTQSAGVDATISLTLSGVTSAVSYEFKNLELVFPDFIVSPQLTNHKLVLNGSLNQGLTKVVHINITSFDFSNEAGGALTITDRKLELNKNVTFSGMITASGLSASTVTGEVKLNATVQVNPATISEIEGKVDPSINVKINTIHLDIPEFLEDDEVTMDVQNPMIRLNVTNDLNIPVIINGVLSGYRNGNKLSQITVAGTSDNPIRIDANGKTVICLSRTGVGGPAGSKNYMIADLNKLVEKIPDEVRFTMNANADQSVLHKIQLGKNYNVGINYAVEVPFKFGPGLSIVYNDTIDDVNKDIKDLDVKSLTVTTTVENNIPLDLQLQATPVGINKSAGALPGLKVEVIGDIKSCDASGGVQQSPLTINLTETTSGALKKLDGLLLKVTAKSNTTVNGKPLREDQYLRLKDIRVKATKGIDVDLNDK
jgi:hypothetical protein